MEPPPIPTSVSPQARAFLSQPRSEPSIRLSTTVQPGLE